MPNFLATKPSLHIFNDDWLDSTQLHTPFGIYRRVLDRPGGALTAAIYYTHLHQSCPTAQVFSRFYPEEKLDLLRDEWFRRHCHFIDTVYQGPEPSFNCADRCPLHKKRGRHVRTDDEEIWELAAATACVKYTAQLNNLAALEGRGTVITGWTHSTFSDLATCTMSLSIIDLPTIPGPEYCPTEGPRPHLLPQHATPLLLPKSTQMGKVKSMITYLPLTPVEHQPLTPTERQPLTPVEHRSLTPSEPQPLTALEHRALAPMQSQPLTPTEYRALTPIEHQPITPFERRPLTLVERLTKSYRVFRESK